MSLNSYQDLKVWQASRLLVGDVYNLCSKLPKEEIYGLSHQMKRAAVSLPSNIAEGYRRNNRKVYVQFMGIALGSAAELETQLILANDIYKLQTSAELKKIEEVQKMLSTMRTNLSPQP